MKNIKFLKNIVLEGKPIWYGGCTYECFGECEMLGRNMYRLMGEDLQIRGIDKSLEGQDFIIEENKTNKNNQNNEKEKNLNISKTNKKTVKNTSKNKHEDKK